MSTEQATSDIQELRNALETQGAELRHLKQLVGALAGRTPPPGPHSRRDLLKFAGAGVIGAAGGAALVPHAARAAGGNGGTEGGSLIIGAYDGGSSSLTPNTSDTTTQLVLQVDASTATGHPSATGYPSVLELDATDPSNPKIGTGVTALTAYSVNGNTGVVVGSDTGWDVTLGGTGRLAGFAGNASSIAPGFPGYVYDPGASFWLYELLRGMNGELWASMYDSSLSLNANNVGYFWRRINTPRFDTPDGTGAPFTPIRVYDSRHGAGRLGSGTTYDVPIASYGTSGAPSIPATAIGVAGNLTAVAPDFNGFLTVYPTGATKPATSTVNFVASGAPTPNGFIAGLGTGGKLTVAAGPVISGRSVDFIVDITAYFQ